jgi:mannitol/fructose-specific phosphotransferase system IIA component
MLNKIANIFKSYIQLFKFNKGIWIDNEYKVYVLLCATIQNKINANR